MQAFPQFNLKAQKYQINDPKFLGEGSYGKVYKIQDKDSGQPRALKQINMDKLPTQELRKGLVNQAQLMSELKSPYTVNLYEYSIGQQYSYMILELCDSDLRKVMRESPKRFPQVKCIQIFSQIANAYRVLSENSCIHRDIKPDNILIKDGKFKLGDFGFACKADLYGLDKLDDICGTPIYMAPQLLRNEMYTAKCDIWSLGIMFYELLCGFLPWPMKCPQSYLNSIKKRPLSFPFDIKMGKQTKNFIKGCLKQKQQERISWQQVYKHPLIANKITGQQSISMHVKPKVRNILANMQKQTQRKFIDQKQIFKKYQTLDSLDKQKFTELLKDLNPTITTGQISIIFKACDQNGNGIIERVQFQQMFSSVNYRHNPTADRELEELIGIIVARQLDPEKLFHQFDKNQTDALDSVEFRQFIQSIAPKFGKDSINVLYSKFDKDKSGLIQKKQFLKKLGSSVIDTKHYTAKWYERAQRNLKTLRICIQDKNMTIDKVMQLADLNNDHCLDENQFMKLVKFLEYEITQQQIKDVFKMIDSNNSGDLNIAELWKFMK